MNQTDDRAQLAEHLKFLGELGVAGVSRDPAWRQRVEPASDCGSEPPESPLGGESGESGEAGGVPVETLEMVRADIGDCTRCKLHALGRSQVVFGAGHPNADLMFVGEAPGYDEDVQGIPFVGRAGQLLTKIIEAIEFTRDQVYIANVVKCRPPENRNPEPDEIATCEPFLFRQVQIVRPKVIVALGTYAAHTLLRTTEPISKLRGRFYKCGDAALMATFHPSFLLRSPDRKRDVWDDMKKVRAVLRGDTAETSA